MNKSIFLTGSSGFVGSNIYNYLSDYNFKFFKRGEIIKINEHVIVNCAGKAHDLKNVSCPNDYYQVNTWFANQIFDAFLNSDSKVFVAISSVKAVADLVEGELSEVAIPNPATHYGKSKLLAEEYILSQQIPQGKKVFILRPCMIHGPGNKGNLNLLYNVVSKGLPWPLGLFQNSRSYLSIENLCFTIRELIEREEIPSGVYNVADDEPLSTNEVIKMIAESNGKKVYILNFSINFIKILARVGDFLKLPLNSERLQKLTESYVVSNNKIKVALGKPFPVSSREGLIRTFQSFSQNV